MIEGTGAYGYDGDDRTSGLAVLHDLGVVIGPIGLVLTMAVRSRRSVSTSQPAEGRRDHATSPRR
jgi:hypothetical protein